ncbi:uncharacterized protein LOC119400981 [Rhipicephalus sanguineus]|uniref:uncharacterized protein LOC119400981 n=1 Tax=Rhipicephalus sanguineus TaxID=34632 RepID=UPI0020C47BA7|nr:uncharacterized protein LOC119400981 [Rhipicephalus sanguineus]
MKFYISNVLAVMVVVGVILLTTENQGPQTVLAVPLPGSSASRPRSRRSGPLEGVPRYRPHFHKNNDTRHQRSRRDSGFSTNVTHVGGPKPRPKRSHGPSLGIRSPPAADAVPLPRNYASTLPRMSKPSKESPVLLYRPHFPQNESHHYRNYHPRPPESHQQHHRRHEQQHGQQQHGIPTNRIHHGLFAILFTFKCGISNGNVDTEKM